MKLNTHLHIMLRIRINGAAFFHTPYAFMASTGTALSLSLTWCYKAGNIRYEESS
jgi:hypothetical protein